MFQGRVGFFGSPLEMSLKALDSVTALSRIASGDNQGETFERGSRRGEFIDEPAT